MLGSGVGSSMSLVRSSSSSSRATADLRCLDEFTAEVRVLENKGLNVTNNIISANTSKLFLFDLYCLSFVTKFQHTINHNTKQVLRDLEICKHYRFVYRLMPVGKRQSAIKGLNFR